MKQAVLFKGWQKCVVLLEGGGGVLRSLPLTVLDRGGLVSGGWECHPATPELLRVEGGFRGSNTRATPELLRVGGGGFRGMGVSPRHP